MPNLEPGIYVVARRLNESGLASYGAHQFVVMVIGKEANACYLNQIVISNHNVIVLGAYNDGGNLLPAYNAPSDTDALKNYLEGNGGLDVDKVKTTMDLNDARGMLQLLTFTFQQKSKKSAISYPMSGGLFKSNCLNSNSYAQSVIEYAFGKNQVKEDFDGLDICHANRIPKEKFY